MNRILKKTLVAGASLLMLASVGATANVNNPVNARHRRTHRVYRHRRYRRTRRVYRHHRRARRHYSYHTSFRHHAWLSGRYFGRKQFFSTNMYYWKHDRSAFKAGFISSLRHRFHWGYPEANHSYNDAVRTSRHNKKLTVTNDDDKYDISGWYVQD